VSQHRSVPTTTGGKDSSPCVANPQVFRLRSAVPSKSLVPLKRLVKVGPYGRGTSRCPEAAFPVGAPRSTKPASGSSPAGAAALSSHDRPPIHGTGPKCAWVSDISMLTWAGRASSTAPTEPGQFGFGSAAGWFEHQGEQGQGQLEPAFDASIKFLGGMLWGSGPRLVRLR